MQLLQRGGASHSLATATGGASRIVNPTVGTEEGDSGVSVFGSTGGEKRFADLLDARLGEERRVQVMFQSVCSYRGRCLQLCNNRGGSGGAALSFGQYISPLPS